MHEKIISFGRSPDCDIVFDDKTVSRHHGELQFIGNKVYVIDNDSTNGTFVNGRRITGRVPLSANDEIKVSNKYRLDWQSWMGGDFDGTMRMSDSNKTVRKGESTPAYNRSSSSHNNGLQNDAVKQNSNESAKKEKPLIEIPSRMEINKNYAEVYRNGEKGADWKVPFKRNMGNNIGNAVGKTLGCIISIIIVVAIIAIIGLIAQ